MKRITVYGYSWVPPFAQRLSQKSCVTCRSGLPAAKLSANPAGSRLKPLLRWTGAFLCRPGSARPLCDSLTQGLVRDCESAPMTDT